MAVTFKHLHIVQNVKFKCTKIVKTSCADGCDDTKYGLKYFLVSRFHMTCGFIAW
jgi:hypothetical protein